VSKFSQHQTKDESPGFLASFTPNRRHDGDHQQHGGGGGGDDHDHAGHGADHDDAYQAWDWDERMLQFAVREPFPSRTSQTRMVFGRVNGNDRQILRSLMPENGVIFSDGIEADYLGFSSGMEAKIGVAERVGRLVV
jgi:hypothetical protein